MLKFSAILMKWVKLLSFEHSTAQQQFFKKEKFHDNQQNASTCNYSTQVPQ
jgi:hypothetical protein